MMSSFRTGVKQLGRAHWNPPAYKTHTLEMERAFMTNLPVKQSPGIVKEIFDSFSENLFHLKTHPPRLHREGGKDISPQFSFQKNGPTHPPTHPAQDV